MKSFKEAKIQVAADKDYPHVETMEVYLENYGYLEIVNDAAELYAQEKAVAAVEAIKKGFIDQMQDQDIWNDIDQAFRSRFDGAEQEDAEYVWREAVRWFIENKLK